MHPAHLKKGFTLLFVFCFLLSQAFAQRKNIDSLEAILATSRDDTSKVNLLYTLAIQYSFFEGNSTKEHIYINQACTLADKLNYELGMAFCLDLQGVGLRNAGKYSDALYFHNKALQTSIKWDHPKSTAIIQNNLGVVYRRLDDYQNALYHHLEALKIAETIGEERSMAIAINSIGNIYLSMKDYGKTLNYLSKGLELEEKAGNKIGIAINLNNLGIVYEHLGEHEKALTYYTKSLEMNRELNNRKGIAICYNDMGNVYKRMHQIDKALSYYNLALRINASIGDKTYTVDNYLNIGTIYMELSQPGRALHYLEKGLLLAKHIAVKQQIQKGYEIISQTYAQTGNYKQAHLNYQKAMAYKDSILDEEKTKNIARMQTLFDTEKKEAQIKILENEKKVKEEELQKRRLIEASLIIGLLCILILLGIVYKNNKHRKAVNLLLAKQNAAIRQQNEEIELQKENIDRKNKELLALNEEKNQLIGIVAHDLKSPLNRIYGLIHIIQLTAQNLTQEQTQYIQYISDATKHLSGMIGKILDVNAIDSQKMNLQLVKTDLSEIVKETLTQFKVASAKKKIAIHYHEAPGNFVCELDRGYATQIFENLLSNAIKFSPPDKNIFVWVSSDTNTIKVCIKDEGPGFTEADKKKIFGKFQKLSAQPTGGENSTGLGLSIVKKYVEAMQGEIICESESGQGATFILTFNQFQEALTNE